MASRKTYFGIGLPKDPTDPPSPVDAADQSQPTVVDDEKVAEGLKQLVEAESDMQVVALVGDGREAVQQARDTQPDVVLMDLSMPELNGADATRAILQRDPKCRVIVLSMYAQREYVRRALKAGAAGYVVKRSAAKEVVEAIRAVHAGQRYLSPRVADVVLEDYTDDKQDDRLACLHACTRSPRNNGWSSGAITPADRARSNSSSTARRPSEPRSIEYSFT